MSEFSSIPAPNKLTLPLKERRKYARAKRAFEMGIWGYEAEWLKGVTLTTKEGERNTWKQMKNDNRQLRKYLKKAGLVCESCLVCEETPKKGLIHLHGFFRVEGGIDAKFLHGMLSTFWAQIHHAPVVWVEDIYWAKGAIAYDVKHALKNYLGYNGESYQGDGLRSRRMLRSKGWLPKGWKQAQKAVVRWAISKRDWWEDETEGNVISALPYVPFKWDLANDFLWRWCNGEEILLDCKNEYLLLQGDKIIEMGGVEENATIQG